jgi:hypothetical protein
MLVAALEQGATAESAIACFGIDRTAGAKRILRALVESS